MQKKKKKSGKEILIADQYKRLLSMCVLLTTNNKDDFCNAYAELTEEISGSIAFDIATGIRTDRGKLV